MVHKLSLNSLMPVGCLMAAFFLSACSGEDVSRAFGLKRAMPDEYTVTTRSPLSMPPSESLLLPDSNAGRPSGQSIRQQALEILSPDVALDRGKDVPSAGQSELVTQANNSADVGRQHELVTDQGFVDQIMFWDSGKPADLAVDGAGENKRIHNNLSLGISPDKGATPTTTKK